MGRGLPSLTLTGLPGHAVQDARERIRPAVEHAGLEWPLRRVVVNLAPANLRKDGPGLDLPIAVAVLAATAQVPERALRGWALAGELSLKGEALSTPGVLSVAIAAVRAGLTGVVVPLANALEAAQIEGLQVVGVSTLAGTSPASSAGHGSHRRCRRRPRPRTGHGGPRRGPRSGPGAAGARGGRRGRPQPAHGGIAGRGQDDAGATARDDPPGSHARRGAGGQPAALGGGPAPRARVAARSPVPGTAPHRLHHRASGRGKLRDAPG